MIPQFVQLTGASEETAQKYSKFPSLESALLSFYKSETNNTGSPVHTQELPFSLKDTHRNEIPLQGINLVARVTDFLADVEVAFKYRNPRPQACEVVFSYTQRECLSSVYHFEVEKEDGTIIRSVCQEASKAVNTYEDAVASSQAAYLFQQNKDGFKLSIGNFLGDSELIIRIKFTQPLSTLNDCLYFSIPFSQTPVLQSSPLESKDGQEFRSKILNGLRLDVYFRLSGQIVQVKPEYKQHNLYIIQDWKNCERPAGEEEIDARLTYFTKHSSKQIGVLIKIKDQELPQLVIEEDLKYAGAPRHNEQRKSSNEETENFSKYIGMVSWMPSTEDIEEIMREGNETEKENEYKEQLTEIIFIVDRSGSMDGNRIDCVKKALKLFLSSIPFGSFFNIIGFGSQYHSLFVEGSQRYDERTLSIAKEHVSKMEADLGGTNVLNPIRSVLEKHSKRIDSLPRKIFLLTDGEVSNVEQVIEFVAQNCGETQIFTFGVGQDVSPTLVNGVANASHAKAEFLVDNDSVIERSVVQQLNRALRPIIHNIEFINLDCLFNNILKQQQRRQGKDEQHPIVTSYEVKQIPKEYSSLYSGEVMIVYFALKPSLDQDVKRENENQNGEEWRAWLRCSIGGKTKTVPIKWNKANDSGTRGLENLITTNPTQIVHRNAAALVLRELEQQLKCSTHHVSRENIRQQMVNLSKRYSLVTKETSLVAVDGSSVSPIEDTPELVHISNIQNDLSLAIDQASRNIDQILQRGERLDVLAAQSELLCANSAMFYKKSRSPFSSFLSAIDSSLSSVGDYVSSLFSSPPASPPPASTPPASPPPASPPPASTPPASTPPGSNTFSIDSFTAPISSSIPDSKPEERKESLSPTASIPELVDHLAHTQCADGSWLYSPSVSSSIGNQFPQLTHNKIAEVFPKKLFNTENNESVLDGVTEKNWMDVWMSILVIVLLETKCSELEEKWILVSRKAQKWISSQISKQFPKEGKVFVEAFKSSLSDEAKKLMN